MKKLYPGKWIGILALVSAGLLLGFISSFYLADLNRSGDKVEPVYAESPVNSDLAGALALQNTYRKVVSDVLPVVVEIDAVEFQSASSPSESNPFRFFFGPQNEDSPEGESGEADIPQFRSEGLGSGIIVKREGETYYVLTNDHVAGNADEITIKLFDERVYEGVLVGSDERKDLALLSFQSEEDLAVALLGDSDDLYVGDFVLAVGNPFGFQSTVTSGIISALGRKQGPEENISDFIQTDASINQGNSGGALVNLRGEVIGVNTWITTPTGGSIGLGFSIPINNARKAIDDIISGGSPEYGWLGVSINNLSDAVAESLGLESAEGAFISQVFKGSPARKGGILPGDVITVIDGREIKTSDELLYVVGDTSPGTRVDFGLIRNKELMTVSVQLEKRDTNDEVSKLSSSTLAWPGVVLLPMTDDIRTGLSIDDSENGVVVYDVYPKTPLQIAGLKSGDLITNINGTAVADLKDFYRLLDDSDKIKITYIREGVTFETSSIVNR